MDGRLDFPIFFDFLKNAGVNIPVHVSDDKWPIVFLMCLLDTEMAGCACDQPHAVIFNCFPTQLYSFQRSFQRSSQRSFQRSSNA